MKTFRFWSLLEDTIRGPDRTYHLRAWGGSDEDEIDALAGATARLAQMRANVAARGLKAAAQYEYGTGVLREEVLGIVAGDPAAPDAVITRNRYGAPVLNARALFIADVDLPPAQKKFWGKSADPADEAMVRVREVAARQGVTLRVYRTPSGLRLIRTDAAMEATSAAALQLLEDFGSDPLYRALCRRQECFRARLGPKPWRVGLGSPTDAFPRDRAAQGRFSKWLGEYESESRNYAACRFVETLGRGEVDGTLAAIVAAHDEQSGALKNLELA